MAQAAHKFEDATTRLHKLAKTNLDKAKGNVTKAIGLMVDEIMKDRALLKEVVAPIVFRAARHSVQQVHAIHRGGFFPRPAVQLTGQERIAALANGISEALLDFPLPGGQRLRDALRSDVAQASELYERQGSNMLVKSRWLRSIAQSVPDGKTVGQAITDERAADLWKEACHDTV